MTIQKFASISAPTRHPRGRAIVVITTFLVVILLLGLAAAAYLFVPWAKPPAVKEVKKTNTPAISPRVLHDPSGPRREKSEPRR